MTDRETIAAYDKNVDAYVELTERDRPGAVLLAFMQRVSAHCRTLDHHPDWRNVHKNVTVSLSTWDARRRVTMYDLQLALFMNRVADEIASHRA